MWITSELSFFCGVFHNWTNLIFIGGVIINNLINDQIQEKEVRLIGEEGQMIGIVSIEEARAQADEAGLDLVLISPKAVPPVCRIIDFGKFRYEQERKEKESRKKQKIIEVKEIRFSPNIDTNDMKTKANMARKFIEHGDKVKVSMRFRGREMSRMQESKHILTDFAAMLEDIANVDKEPKVEGRNMVMFLSRKK
ncbi:MAG: translation initiation factor IF-3 [Lachnospiraceae bacterium]|nr:translation initiation factor IF-3 [Lachnospiraceae bacterium]